MLAWSGHDTEEEEYEEAFVFPSWLGTTLMRSSEGMLVVVEQ